MTAKARWIDEAEALHILARSGSWRQYPAYAATAAQRVGASSRYALVSRDNQALAVANIRSKQVPLLGASHLISHGPVMLSSAENDWDHSIASLRDLLGDGELRIDTAIRTPIEGAQASYRTIILDLSHGAETVNAGFDPKWRRDLARGTRENLHIRRSSKPEDFLTLQPLLADLAQKKGFGITQDCAFFAQAAQKQTGDERFFVHLISRDGVLLSGHIGAFSGNCATYLIGATTRQGRDLRASYVAQWAVIETALELGLTHYDLGGIDAHENPDVYRFKRRMGGVEMGNSGLLIFPASGLRGKALAGLRQLYQKARA